MKPKFIVKLTVDILMTVLLFTFNGLSVFGAERRMSG